MFKRCLIKTCIIISIFCYSLAYANNDPKPTYYRYTDSKGVVSISRNVSQAHVRHGYEVLDRNMYLIKKIPAYNLEQDLKQEKNRASEYKQKQQDLQFKRSYRNVKYATEKKQEAIKIVQKQINEQYLRMKTLQADRADFLTQKSDLIFNKKPIPTHLQKKLDNNEASIKHVRQMIEHLKNHLAQQQQFYDDIIKRLQTME